MSRITRSLIAAAAACTTLTLVAPTTGYGVPPAPATTALAAAPLSAAPLSAAPLPGVPLSVVRLEANDRAAADAASDYIVSQLSDGHVADDTGGATADVVLSLIAIGGQDAAVQESTDWLVAQAGSYAVDNGPAAGKLAVVAAATGHDPRDFGGVDLVEEIESQILPDGQCGDFGSAFGQSWCVLGLERADQAVPQVAVDFLIAFQDDSGAYGFETDGTFTADNDTSGLTLAALAGVLDQPGAEASAVALRDYLRTQQQPGGYWTNFSPVNTTGVVGTAMQLVGDDVSEATAWMVGQQLADGGLPNVLDGQTADLMATTQGAMLLAGESYLSVGEGGADRVELEGDDPATGPIVETDIVTGDDEEQGGPVLLLGFGAVVAGVLMVLAAYRRGQAG